MNKNYKVIIVIFLFITTFTFYGCNKDIEHVQKENVSTSESKNNENQEEWKILESVEYGFTVKYPKGWRINPGGKNIGTNTKSLIKLTSPNANGIIFNVYRVNIASEQPYKKIPFDKQLLELKDNQEMIDKYGEAFRYFRGVYSFDLDDDFARRLPLRSERTEEDFYDENHVFVNINDSTHQEEDLAIMKEILKSFQR